jgi:hypothetical protein
MSNRYLSCATTAAFLGSACGFRALAAFDLGFKLVDEENEGDADALAEVAKLDDIYAAFASFYFPDYGARDAHASGDLILGHAGCFTSLTQLAQEKVVVFGEYGLWYRSSPIKDDMPLS